MTDATEAGDGTGVALDWSRFDFKAVSLFSQQKGRDRTVYSEFSRVGLDGVVPVWSAPSPYEDAACRRIKLGSHFRGRAVNITLKHQQMVRIGYDSGADMALFMESDIRFVRDLSYLSTVLRSLPEDADVALFDWKIVNPHVGRFYPAVLEQATRTGNPWVRYSFPLVQAGCYALSRKGMRAYLDELERPADGVSTLMVCDRYWTQLVDKHGCVGYVAAPCPAVQCVDGGNSSLGSAWAGYRAHGLKIEDYGPVSGPSGDDVPPSMRAAAVWSTDGGDFSYLRYSIESFERNCSRPHDIFVLCTDDVDISSLPHHDRIRRIDPTAALSRYGIVPGSYTGRWRFPIFYKLAIPLLDVFREYRSVANFDSDILFYRNVRWGIDTLFDYRFSSAEVAAVPDLYLPSTRGCAVALLDTPDDIRGELSSRVWDSTGTWQHGYVNVGVMLWNVKAIDLEWYGRRLSAFWTQRTKKGNERKYHYPEQDFVNSMMAVDAGLGTRYNHLNRKFYNNIDICARHYTGSGKSAMVAEAEKLYGKLEGV